MSNHILLIDCPDEAGLILKITEILFQHAQNIIRNDEFVTTGDRYFFMRTEFEGEVNEGKLLEELAQALPANAIIRLNPKKKKDIVVLATKEAHCLGDLLVRYQFNELDGNIQAVISNHKHLQPLVGAFGIPFHYISHEHKSREQHEEAILRTLEVYQPEYLVLAKYMRILRPEFVQHYPQRIINIHHSFLPAFIGANPYKQAYLRGVKIIGATAHFVNHELDEGPIIAQDVHPIDHKLSIKEIAQAGKDVEKTVLARALKLVFQDRVFIYQNKTIVF